jgi:hypothetical protein
MVLLNIATFYSNGNVNNNIHYLDVSGGDHPILLPMVH